MGAATASRPVGDCLIPGQRPPRTLSVTASYPVGDCPLPGR